MTEDYQFTSHKTFTEAESTEINAVIKKHLPTWRDRITKQQKSLALSATATAITGIAGAAILLSPLSIYAGACFAASAICGFKTNRNLKAHKDALYLSSSQHYISGRSDIIKTVVHLDDKAQKLYQDYQQLPQQVNSQTRLRKEQSKILDALDQIEKDTQTLCKYTFNTDRYNNLLHESQIKFCLNLGDVRPPASKAPFYRRLYTEDLKTSFKAAKFVQVNTSGNPKLTLIKNPKL